MGLFSQITIRLLVTSHGAYPHRFDRQTFLEGHTGTSTGVSYHPPSELEADYPRSWFNDLPSIPDTSSGNNKPHKISLRGDERLDAVKLTLVSGKRYSHGGTGGALQELVMGDNEYWTEAKLCRGKHNDSMRNFYLAATTSAGNTVAAGEMTPDCQEFKIEDGWQIVGFYGEDGDEIDQLGFITARI